jgi:hypothetical protein
MRDRVLRGLAVLEAATAELRAREKPVDLSCFTADELTFFEELAARYPHVESFEALAYAMTPEERDRMRLILDRWERAA